MPRVEWKSRSYSSGRQPIVGRQLIFRNNLEHASKFVHSGDTYYVARSGSGAPQEEEGIDSSIPSHSSSSEVTRKSTAAHAAEALNQDLFIRFIHALFSSLSKLHCCNGNYSQDSTCYDYETNWQGHQPLTPNNWSFIDEDDLASAVSASEQRMMRRRRRRGAQTEHWCKRNSILTYDDANAHGVVKHAANHGF